MDKIKIRENSGVIIVHGNRVNNLRFADDIDIIEHMDQCEIVEYSRQITYKK